MGEDQAGPSALHSKLEASSQSLNFPWRDLSRLIRSKHSLCQIITLFSRQLQNLLYQLARSPAAAVYRWLLVRWLRVCPAEKAGTRERRAGSGPGAPRCCLWEWAAEGGRPGGHPGEWSPRTTLAAIALFWTSQRADVTQRDAADPGVKQVARVGPGPGLRGDPSERARTPSPLWCSQPAGMHPVRRAPRSGVFWKDRGPSFIVGIPGFQIGLDTEKEDVPKSERVWCSGIPPGPSSCSIKHTWSQVG